MRGRELGKDKLELALRAGKVNLKVTRKNCCERKVNRRNVWF